ncbi:MAG: SRPBCC family protein [Bryobacteraceae bacterium]
MHVYKLESTMLIETSLQDTFAFFEDPYNLKKITPSWMRFEVTSKDRVAMRKDAEIEYRIRWMGLPMYWKTIITEYEPPFLFVDEQAKGPYSFWRHRHNFSASEKGTKIFDHLEYALPLGVLGRLAHRVLVSRQLREIFAYRQQALSKIFDGKELTLQEPVIR